jgi:hypothetical protein
MLTGIRAVSLGSEAAQLATGTCLILCLHGFMLRTFCLCVYQFWRVEVDFNSMEQNPSCEADSLTADQ